jgi:hydrophobe/amphiphile efflux-3 (HAE3) family protein
LRTERIIRLLLARRWFVLVVLTVFTFIAGSFATRVSFNNSLESWFLENDPSLAIYDRFTRLFTADQIVVVGIFADDVFRPAVIQAVDRITIAAGQLEHVERVHSITNSAIAARADGIENPAFREQVMQSPLQLGLSVSENGDATAIVIYFSRAGDSFDAKRNLVAGLAAIAEDETEGLSATFALAGGPVLGAAGQVRNKNDMMTLVPVMIGLILAISFGIFRRVSLTLLPMAVVAIAVTWSYGLMGLIGWQMTMISAILIPLILAIGVADSIHVIARYRRNLQNGQAHDAAIRDSCIGLLAPCFFTTLTTVLGLLSLLVSDLGPVREFALTAAAGVFAAFVASLSFLPAALLLMPSVARGRATLAGGWVGLILAWQYKLGLGKTKGILIGSLITAITFGSLATRVEAGLDPLSWIRHDDPIRVDAERIDEAFGGGLSLEFLVTARQDGLREPEALRRIESFQAWLMENTPVVRATSIVDMVKESARIARGGDSAGFALPNSNIATDLLLDRLLSARDLSHWVSSDFSTARISARLRLGRAREFVALAPVVERQIAMEFAGTGLQVHMTGNAVLAGKMQSYVIENQIETFTLAIVVVSLVMILIFRSTVLGLLAMIPNLLPIVIGLGVMALFDISLNPGTVMIAAVALGIVVDDTVHLMTTLERQVKLTDDFAHAIRNTIVEVGRPVVVTSILLALGFAVLIMGSFLPSRQIGGLIAVIVVAALVTDLVLLPAILRLLPASVFGGSSR